MSEFTQSRRLQDAELSAGPELWARLEGRLAGRPEQSPRRFRMGYWAVAASLLLAFWGGMYWQSLRQHAPASMAATSAPAGSARMVNKPMAATLTASATLVPDAQDCQPETDPAVAAPFLAAKPAFVARRQTQRCQTARPASVAAVVKRQDAAHPNPTPQPEEASLGMTVSQFNAPALILPPADSLRVISPAIGSKDSLAILMAVTTPRPGRDSLKSAKTKPLQRQTIINKINRALRWLPGGSAWPTIRFEKADVAVAFHEEPHQGVAP